MIAYQPFFYSHIFIESNTSDIIFFRCQLNFSIVFFFYLKSASNLNGNLNCSKELEHYSS